MGGVQMEAATHSQSAVPLTILTGFLGAGKTTLLNRILIGEHGLRVAVLVNDFGSVNIDAELVVGVEDSVISLTNGCVCCSIRDDLVESVDQVLARPEAVDYVILEASGVADPMSLAATFSNPGLRERIRLDSITCVVDAEQVLADLEYPAYTRLKLLQIGCADMVILNKVDLAGPKQLQKVKNWIDDQFNRVRIVEASHCRVPLEILMSVGRFDATRLAANIESTQDNHGDSEHMHDHVSDFATWSYQNRKPLSLEALRDMVKRRLPASVFRCKGIVHSTDAPDRRGVLQVVGRRSDVTLDRPWDAEVPQTRVVAIGAPGAIKSEELKTLFDSCIVMPFGTGPILTKYASCLGND